MDVKTIIKALRCTNGVGSKCEGSSCPYYFVEHLTGELAEKFGSTEYPSCDYEKIGLDAADKLEEIERMIEEWQKSTSTCG